jgi:hypothetical protein
MREDSASGVQWSKAPPEHQKPSLYRLVRTPAKSALVFTCLSHEHAGALTHYYGRSMPCIPGACKPCEAGRVAEWHGWVIGLVDGTEEKCIIEFTPGCAEIFNNAFSKFRTLRGRRFKMFRPSGRANGKVVAQLSEQDVESAGLPKAPEVWPIMCSIWRLKPELLQPAKQAPRFLPGQLELLNGKGNELEHD